MELTPRRLAPDDADLPALGDLDGDVIEDGRTLVVLGDVGQGKERHGAGILRGSVAWITGASIKARDVAVAAPISP